MFRKLRLQFILTNLGIISALFVTLTVGAYAILEIKMINHAEVFSKRLAMGINSGVFPGFPADDARPPRFEGMHDNPSHGIRKPPVLPPGPPRPTQTPPSPGFFFVKTDFSGNMLFQSFREPWDALHLTIAIQSILKADKASGIVDLFNSKYHYYRAPLQKESGMLIVFQDLKQDKNIQHSLVVSLSIVGVVFFILAMLGSLFMAGRAIAPIQKAWRQQQDFLADASHELRTPLAIIQTNLEVVLSDPEETVASQTDWLNNIQEELRQMTFLVSSLLFLARADSKSNVLDSRDFALNQTVTRVSEAFKPAAAAKDIRIETTAMDKVICHGNESNIRQVMEILLDNAVRHTPSGGRVKLDLGKTEKKIHLTVSDTGEGIPPEHLDKIFDRFYQVDSSRSNGKAGLGLSIAKCIIENHGGTIRVASKPGQGTVFTILLPLPNARIRGNPSIKPNP